MSAAYDLHRSGDCWPDTCPVCSQECAGCLEWKHVPDPARHVYLGRRIRAAEDRGVAR